MLRRSLPIGAVAISIPMVAVAFAGSAQAPTPHVSVVPLNPPQDTIYIASGSTGSNNGIIIGKTGVILIDTGVSTAAEQLELDEIAKITSKPITTAIITHSDADHVTGLAVLPPLITIIAQENCKKEMEAAANAPLRGAAPSGPRPQIPLPTNTIDTKAAMTIDGVRFEFLHVAPAHTSGDLMTYLPDEKTVFTGDIIADNTPYPIIHLEKNGSSEGWIESVTGLVKFDANTFVPGHGAVHTKAEIEQRLASVKERRAEIQSLVLQGKSLDEIKQQLGETTPAAGGRGPRFPSFTDVVYRELTTKN
ncbi:MAG TPA: MBL fold metallo-hydrolase [Candidatus Aquilonibacter sp.]|nr:MBL fold metallo-hydrolase [Candidatus Aquilonibacter sp.]